MNNLTRLYKHFCFHGRCHIVHRLLQVNPPSSLLPWTNSPKLHANWSSEQNAPGPCELRTKTGSTEFVVHHTCPRRHRSGPSLIWILRLPRRLVREHRWNQATLRTPTKTNRKNITPDQPALEFVFIYSDWPHGWLSIFKIHCTDTWRCVGKNIQARALPSLEIL